MEEGGDQKNEHQEGVRRVGHMSWMEGENRVEELGEYKGDIVYGLHGD